VLFKLVKTRIPSILGKSHNLVFPDCRGQWSSPFVIVCKVVCNGLDFRDLLPVTGFFILIFLDASFDSSHSYLFWILIVVILVLMERWGWEKAGGTHPLGKKGMKISSSGNSVGFSVLLIKA